MAWKKKDKPESKVKELEENITPEKKLDGSDDIEQEDTTATSGNTETAAINYIQTEPALGEDNPEEIDDENKPAAEDGEDEQAPLTSENKEEDPSKKYYTPVKAVGKGANKGRSSLIAGIIAGIILAGAIGFLGGWLAVDNKTADLEEQLDNNITTMLEEAGAAVLYRSVETDVTTKEDETSLSIPTVTELCADSVVEISTEVTGTAFDFFGASSYLLPGAGSGIIISENGYILTCQHVIKDAEAITVGLRDGQSYEAELIAADEQSDVAILKIAVTDLTVAVLGSSDKLEVGDTIVAIGNPLGALGGSVTSGIVSALDREVTVQYQGTFNVIQTDAAINSGNSGGGLFNNEGELIGMVNAKASDVGVEGLAFALPIDDLRGIIEDLLNYGYVTTSGASLGVVLLDILDEDTAVSYRVDDLGCYILRVKADSNAAYAGLESGDLIVSIDGTDIENADQVVSIIAGHQVNDEIQIKLKRDGKLIELELTLYANIPSEG